MNRFTPAVLLGMCLLASSFCYGDLAKGDQMFFVSGGVGGSGTEFDYSPGDREPVTRGGGAFGAQYLYYVKSSPTISLGLDLTSSLNGNSSRDDLLQGYGTTARMKSLVGLVVARLSYPRGKVRPYIFAGVGGHNSTERLTAQPLSGNTWPGGGTETRTMVDENETSMAVGGGIGIDVFLRENVFFGVEYRSVVLPALDTDDTAALRSAGFTVDDNNVVSQQDLLFHAGIKF